MILNGVLRSGGVWFRWGWVSDADGGEERDGFVASGASGAGDSDGADESGRSDGWAVLYSTTQFINVCEC